MIRLGGGHKGVHKKANPKGGKGKLNYSTKEDQLRERLTYLRSLLKSSGPKKRH